MSDVLISAKGLVKRFGAIYAARDITVDIHEKTVTGLIGTNGAGKTTFVNMITGYLQPDEGEILYQGKSVVGLSSREITHLGVARSFQIPQLFITHSALENVEIALGVAKQPLSRAMAVLDQFGLQRFAHLEAGTLPEGVRKLLDIALAMVAEPKVLLLDEPTSGVASDEKFEVMERVMEVIRNQGVTALFVEHDMEIISRYSDVVLAFYDGAILSQGSVDTVLNNDKVLEYIIGEPTTKAEEVVRAIEH